MSVPVKFADLNKSVKDLFTKQYNAGEAKVEIKTKTSDGVEFTTVASNDIATSSNVAASIESKYKYAPYGLTITDKWATSNRVNLDAHIEDKLAPGLKVGVETQFTPTFDEKSVKVVSAFKKSNLNLTADFDLFAKGGLQFSTTGVVKYNDFIVGYDVAAGLNGNLTKTNFAVGVAKKDYTWTSIVDKNRITTSLFHSVNPSTIAAVQFHFNRNLSDNYLQAGGQFNLDKDTIVKAKLDTNSVVGVSLTQNLRQGVKLSLSSQYNVGKSTSSVGLHLLFDA